MTIHREVLENGDILERPYNDAEMAEFEAAQAKAAERQLEIETKAAQKAALLNRLGVTEEEAKLLLA
jgi:hypothetical protein